MQVREREAWEAKTGNVVDRISKQLEAILGSRLRHGLTTGNSGQRHCSARRQRGTPPLSVPLAVTARSNTLIGQSGISSLIDQSWAPQQTETLRNSSVVKSRRDLQCEKGGITPRRLLIRKARERAAQHSTAHHRTRSIRGPSAPRRRRAYSIIAWVGLPARA